MQPCRIVSELAHVAQHEKIFARQRCKELRGGGDAKRVGVIAVVVDRRAVDPCKTPEPTLDGLHRLQRELDICNVHAGRDRNRGGSAGIPDVVSPGKR